MMHADAVYCRCRRGCMVHLLYIFLVSCLNTLDDLLIVSHAPVYVRILILYDV